MSNKATTIPELQPTTELAEMAKTVARFPFTATTLEQARAWQTECRKALADTLGFLDTPKVDPNPEVIEEVDRGDFIRRKVMISTAPLVKMPVYILVPKGAKGPLPVVIANHGHGYGVKDIVGQWRTVRSGCRPKAITPTSQLACVEGGFSWQRRKYPVLASVRRIIRT